MKKLLITLLIALAFGSLSANAATLKEGFEANKTDSYTTTSVQGDACTWTLSNAGVYTDNPYAGKNSLRFGNNANSSATMASNKAGGAGTVSFYAREWSAADGEVTIAVQYSTNSGSTWTTAGKVTLTTTTYAKKSVAVNKTGNVRIRLLQTAGKRALIDDISVPDYSGGSTTSASLTTPAAGSTVDFGTVTVSKSKTNTVVVKGTNLTSAVTVTVSGTGFRVGATTLSAAKVNSTAGAQLQVLFKEASAGSYTGTLTLKTGTLTRKVSLKARIADAGQTATPDDDGTGSGSGSGSGTGSGSAQTGATNSNIPANYYKAAEGKCGKELLTALAGIVGTHKSVSYSGLWTAYQQTDTKPNGKIWDMYTTKEFTYKTDQCGNYTGIGVCYNREHSFPKSWFKDATPMYTDLFHVYPTDGYVNNQRGNYPFGECAGGTYVATKNGVSAKGKLGKSTLSGYTGTVWEPDDEYKGDFARSYLYMAAAYNSKIAGWNSDMLNKTSYPAFSTWAIDMLLRWNALDPVSTKETARQEAVYAKQNNRNPFIDYPDLADYIWGNKKTTPWSASAAPASRISQPADGSTLNFGTVATGATNEKIVAVKGAAIKDNVSVSVTGNGFEASAEWLDASQVNTGGPSVAKARALATAADEEDSDGALLKITFTVPEQSDYKGTLVLTTGNIVNTVTLEGKALDGLPAAEAENVEATSFTARWVNVGDELDGDCYRLDVTEDGVSISGYPRNVAAGDLTYNVDGLEPEHTYKYTLTNASTVSNTVTVTTPKAKPALTYQVEDYDVALETAAGTPSQSIGFDVFVENYVGDITFTVNSPFEISADNAAWGRQAIVNSEAGQLYLRLGSCQVAGEYLTPLRATAGDYTEDPLTAYGLVTSTGGTSAPYLIEDFEASAKDMNAYTSKTYNGTACAWTLDNALLQAALTSHSPFYDGSYSLRVGPASSPVNVTMLEDVIAPNSRISFYAAKWNAKEDAMTLNVDFSDDGGKTWATKHTVVIDKEAATPADYTLVNVDLKNTLAGRIRIRKDANAGGRGLIDNIAARPGTSTGVTDARTTTWTVTSPAPGTLTVTVPEPAEVTVYGVDGTTYYSARVEGTLTLTLPVGQLYLVTSPNHHPRRIVL